MARIKLTKNKAQELLRAREGSGKSQYEVADALGWVRSKIKRIEKAEISTIDEDDLVQLERFLNVQESSSKKAPAKKTPVTSSEKGAQIISMFKPDKLFSKVRHLLDRHTEKTRNQVFFEVTMAQQMSAEELLNVRKVELLGVTGSINGVENTQDQTPLRAGDRVVIMLWGSGIAQDLVDLNVRARRARG